MKLIEALRIVGDSRRSNQPSRKVHLLCGFTPLHLATFLHAMIQQRATGHQVELSTGLYGDLLGNIERARGDSALEVAIIVEWSDLDARLGWRSTGGWRPSDLPDIVSTVERSLGRLEAGIATLAAAGASIVVSPPSLPMTPVSYTPGPIAGMVELEGFASLSLALRRLANTKGVKILSSRRTDLLSPMAARSDVRAELSSGFPYSQSHAVVIARLLAETLVPDAPKKGLITDLDDTLWRGILGDVGIEGIASTLEEHAHAHGMYQQLLGALAKSGTLLAIASKNDAALVEEALKREGQLVAATDFYPIMAHWESKSQSVAEILRIWNVGEDSVVFVDDSLLELAEVKSRFPMMECLQFPKDDPAKVAELIHVLRDRFGKSALSDEDAFRLESIRRSSELTAVTTAPQDADAFLSTLDAEIHLELSQNSQDDRALELVNKTNQFNINGRRFSAQEWNLLVGHPSSFLLTASYNDKFGPLGKIAVLSGTLEGRNVHVNSWVMSCRAFSRRIEFQCLNALFELFATDHVSLDYSRTDRNGPTRDFLEALGLDTSTSGILTITRSAFSEVQPTLHHRLQIKNGVSLSA